MFKAEDFVDIAKDRYGEAVLRERMRGARGDTDKADGQLLTIANGVIARVQDAIVGSVGWPLPGTWPAGSEDDDGTPIAGTAYADIWPKNLLQKALDLFNWRTVSGLDEASENQRRVGKMAEDYFDGVESGANGIGILTTTDLTTAAPIAARNRDGSSNVAGVPDQENILDIFTGLSWDG